MNALTDYLLALVDYLQAEGRRARRAIMCTAAALGLLSLAALLLVASLGLLLWSLYAALAVPLGSSVAALLVSLAALLVAALVALAARRLVR